MMASDAHLAASQTPSRIWLRGVIPEVVPDEDDAAQQEPKRVRQQLDSEQRAQVAAPRAPSIQKLGKRRRTKGFLLENSNS